MPAYPIVGLATQGNSLGAYAAKSYLNGGKALAGNVRRNGEAARAIIVLHRRSDGMPIFRTRSRLDGSWRVDNLRAEDTYYLVCFDPGGQYNAEIADLMTPG